MEVGGRKSEVGSRDRARAKSRDKKIQVGSPRTLGDETRVIYIEDRIGVAIERRVIRKRARLEPRRSVPKRTKWYMPKAETEARA